MLEAFAGTPDFTVQLVGTFDYPDDTTSTQPQKISDLGAVVGAYVDTSGITRAFVRFANGHFSAPLVDPNDTTGVTQGRGINNSTRICGNYTSDTSHGFFKQGATYYDYDVPGSTFTVLLGINNVGDFSGSDIPSSGVQSGFVSIGGVVTEFVVTDATATLAYMINSSDQPRVIILISTASRTVTIGTAMARSWLRLIPRDDRDDRLWQR